MSIGKARHKLIKSIIIHLLNQLNKNSCFKCGQEMDENSWSIEHIEPWLHISTDLFWNLENISFSHKTCNRPHRNVGGRRKKRSIV